MAKQTAGFMGGFHGRLGPAVGYMWRGQWCMRSYNPAPRNPRTPEQVAHREMFKREVQLAASMSWAVNLGFRELSYDNGMTPYNMFVHLNQGAFSLVDNIFTVDYSALRLCSGPVAGVAFGNPVWGEGNVLTVTFDRDASGQRGEYYDSVYLYAYCPDMEDGFLAAPVYRRTRKITVALPDSYAGHEVHLYGMIVNEEGEWSETVYAGSVSYSSPLTSFGSPSPTLGEELDSTATATEKQQKTLQAQQQRKESTARAGTNLAPPLN